MIQVFKFPRETILDSHVTNCGFATVGQVAAWKPEYNFIINGDGWPDGGRTSNSIWYSEGGGKNQKQMEWRPWINFNKSNEYKFGRVIGTHFWNFNCVSGSRFIVERGAVNSQSWRWSPELNARTAIGIAYNGDLVVAVVDGYDKYKETFLDAGLSLLGLAELMIENDCETAMDLDGGGSTTLYVNGVLANEPNDDGIPGERAVVNHLCLRLLEIPGTEPPPVEPPPNPEPSSIPPIIETKELDGTPIGRYIKE